MNDDQPCQFVYPSPAPGRISPAALVGSKDSAGARDHDQPFAGFRAYQFSTRQLARLLMLRGQVLEAKLCRSLLAADLNGMPATAPQDLDPQFTRYSLRHHISAPAR
ncbi:MAG TPA: hypothetical protein VKQ30_11040 [Ktedonobacterales bacterium]|nr:hypothetical protein [Ktedonobacterales bacterium]